VKEREGNITDSPDHKNPIRKGGEEKKMISVLLCTLNRPVQIRDCISSFLDQTYSDFEIIVVDQSKDDLTKKSCEEFDDRRIKYHKVNFTGLSRARNYGLRFVQGEWICLGDDDAVYDRDFFSKAYDFLKDYKKVCILCGKLLFLDDKRKEAMNYKDYHSGQELKVDDMMQIGASATLVLQSELLNTIKGFDPIFGVGARYGSGEESDVVLRMFERGIKAYYIPEMKVFHGYSTTNAFEDIKKVFLYYTGLGALLKKHLWYRKNINLLPKFFRATLGAWIKWIVGNRNQKCIYRARIVGFYKGFFNYNLI